MLSSSSMYFFYLSNRAMESQQSNNSLLTVGRWLVLFSSLDTKFIVFSIKVFLCLHPDWDDCLHSQSESSSCSSIGWIAGWLHHSLLYMHQVPQVIGEHHYMLSSYLVNLWYMQYLTSPLLHHILTFLLLIEVLNLWIHIKYFILTWT